MKYKKYVLIKKIKELRETALRLKAIDGDAKAREVNSFYTNLISNMKAEHEVSYDI